jgi:phage shock protein E
MKKTLIIFLAIFSCGRDTRDVGSESLPPVEFKQSLSTGVVLIDVRTPDEYASGFIAGAANMDFLSGGFAGSLDSLDKSKTYLLYCAAGARSDKAAAMMREKGFENVKTLKGGLNAWSEEGLSLD